MFDTEIGKAVKDIEHDGKVHILIAGAGSGKSAALLTITAVLAELGYSVDFKILARSILNAKGGLLSELETILNSGELPNTLRQCRTTRTFHSESGGSINFRDRSEDLRGYDFVSCEQKSSDEVFTISGGAT